MNALKKAAAGMPRILYSMEEIMKKRILVVAVLAMALAAAGCGSKPAKDASKAVADASKAVNEAASKVEEAVSEAAKDASKAIDEAVSEAGEVVSEVEKAASEAVGDASKAIDEVVSEAEELATEVEEAVSEAVGDASKAVDEAVSEAEELASDVEEAVSEAVEDASEAIDEAASEAEELATEALEELSKIAEDPFAETEEESSEEALEPVEVDHEGYVAAELNTPVIVETYVQATQSWWRDAITVYAQSEDGAYSIFNMACSEEDAKKLVPGTKIRVTGWKSEWSGEVEIIDATFEIIDDAEPFIAEAEDVTELLGKDELIDSQNKLVSFKGLTIEASKDADGKEAAFLYNWDGSGSQEANSDLYFNASVDGETYTFTVESYLCNNETDVYKAVEGLEIGQKIDAEGFLYWYEGANPHITSIKVVK